LGAGHGPDGAAGARSRGPLLRPPGERAPPDLERWGNGGVRGFGWGFRRLTRGGGFSFAGAGGLLLPDGLLQRPDEPAAPGEPVLHEQEQRRQAGLRDGAVVSWRDGGGTNPGRL